MSAINRRFHWNVKHLLLNSLLLVLLGLNLSYSHAQLCGPGTSLVAGRWTMISLPCLPASNTVQDVFGDDLGNADYDFRWVVYEYNESIDTYVKLTLASPLNQGESYWILSLDNASVGFTGTATPLTTGNANCPSPSGCFEVMLTPPDTNVSTRQNMAGHPFPFDVDWADVVVEVDGVAHTPSAADTAGLVSKTINKYNGSSYSPFDDTTPGMTGVLNTYDGFWVETLGGSAGKSVKLLIGDTKQPPVAQDDSYSFSESADQNVPAGTGLFADNGSGADILGAPAATLTFFGAGSLGGAITDNSAGASVSLAGGTLTVNADGSWSLTGQPFTPGTYTFDYRLSNANGTSDATVTLVIASAAACNNDSYSVTGNVTIDSTNGVNQGLLFNDTGGPLSVTAFDATSNNGGTVNVQADGEFTYTPPAGFTGADSFTYTANTTLTCTVNLTISDMIWFIDNSQGAAGDGTLSSPFNSLTGFNASATDLAGDSIFISRQSASNYSGPLMLLNNQILIGQGAGDSIVNITGITPAPLSNALPATGGTRPVIAHTSDNLTLGQSNTVRGLDLSNSGGTALTGTNFGNLSLSEVSVNNTAGTAINLATGNPTASFTSVSASGGTNGIILNNTTGSFSVTGTGTTSGTGGTLSNLPTAVSLTSAANVSLNNMVINSTTSHGIQGTSISNLDLTNVQISDTGGTTNNVHGVSITNLSGTSTSASVFDDVTISNTADDGIYINNTTATGELTVQGATLFTNTGPTIGNSGFGIFLETNGAAADLTTTIGNTSAQGAVDTVTFDGTHGAAIVLHANTGDITATVKNSLFTGTGSQISNAVEGVSEGTSGNSTLTTTVTGNNITIPNGVGTARGGISVSSDSAAGTGNASGTISNNTINSPEVTVFGIRVANVGTGTASNNSWLIDNNVIDLTATGPSATTDGIVVEANNPTGSPGLSATVTNNSITASGASGFTGGLEVFAGLFGAPGNNFSTVCAHLAGNFVDAPNSTADGTFPAGDGDIIIASFGTNTAIQIQGLTGGTSTVAVDNFVTNANINPPTDVFVFGSNYSSIGACSLP